MYSFAGKIYKSVVGRFEKQTSEENAKHENTKNQEASQNEQKTVKVSTVEETSNTANNHREFAVPAPIPKMQVSNFNGIYDLLNFKFLFVEFLMNFFFFLSYL